MNNQQQIPRCARQAALMPPAPLITCSHQQRRRRLANSNNNTRAIAPEAATGLAAANAVSVVADADGTATSALPLVGAALVAALGAGGLRAALYSTLEYAKAAALARFVPKGAATPSSRGAKVVLVGAAPRDIYYLPKDTLSATVIGGDVNPSLFDQAGVSAGVPTTGKRVGPGEPWGGGGVAAAGSLDAVVVLGSALGKMATGEERSAFLREAVRALRPGRPLVLLQALAEGGSFARGLIGPGGGGGGGAMPASELERALEQAGFAYLEWEVQLEGTDPHALGVAVSPQEGGDEGEANSSSGGKKRRKAEAATTKQGF
jgi:hypothetical protein